MRCGICYTTRPLSAEGSQQYLMQTETSCDVLSMNIFAFDFKEKYDCIQCQCIFRILLLHNGHLLVQSCLGDDNIGRMFCMTACWDITSPGVCLVPVFSLSLPVRSQHQSSTQQQWQYPVPLFTFCDLGGGG